LKLAVWMKLAVSDGESRGFNSDPRRPTCVPTVVQHIPFLWRRANNHQPALFDLNVASTATRGKGVLQGERLSQPPKGSDDRSPHPLSSQRCSDTARKFTRPENRPDP
jgi:hypothetical protein